MSKTDDFFAGFDPPALVIPRTVEVRADDLRRWESWFQIQAVAHTGELSAKARSIRDDMQRYLTAK